MRDSLKLSNNRAAFSGPIIPPVSVNPELLPYRQLLPIWQMRDTIVQAISANQVIIINGETGCGKTTQVNIFSVQFEICLYFNTIICVFQAMYKIIFQNSVKIN